MWTQISLNGPSSDKNTGQDGAKWASAGNADSSYYSTISAHQHTKIQDWCHIGMKLGKRYSVISEILNETHVATRYDITVKHSSCILFWVCKVKTHADNLI